MQVILLEDVMNLGALGDVISVKAGYGRNYLIPKGRALPATKGNRDVFELRRSELEQKMLARQALTATRAEKIGKLTLAATVKTTEEGKLFGSIGAREIAEIITSAGVDVDRHEAVFDDGPIRQIGMHRVVLRLNGEVEMHVAISVTSENFPNLVAATEESVAAELVSEQIDIDEQQTEVEEDGE